MYCQIDEDPFTQSSGRDKIDLWRACNHLMPDWGLSKQLPFMQPFLKHDDDGIEIIKPGHFLTGQPLESLPDKDMQGLKTSQLKCWNLCQGLVQSFWTQWCHKYIGGLERLAKWKHPARNLKINDVVLVHEDTLIATRWTLARLVQVHPGAHGRVKVVTIRTASGTYNRPVVSLALLPLEDDVG